MAINSIDMLNHQPDKYPRLNHQLQVASDLMYHVCLTENRIPHAAMPSTGCCNYHVPNLFTRAICGYTQFSDRPK